MLRRIVLALAAAGLLAAGFALVLRDRDRSARSARADARLPSFDDRQVTGLTLATREATWQVTRDGDRWRLASPVEDAADPKSVEAVIAAARRTRVVQAIQEPEALSAYGLDPPVATLTLAGVTVPALSIGQVAPTGEAVYARVAERAGVLLLAMPDAAPLVADPIMLRDRTIVDLARSEIDAIEIEPGSLRIARNPGGWWIESPRRAPASTSQVDKLLGGLYAAKVAEWDDRGRPSDPRFGLGAGATRVVLRYGSASCAVLLGADAGGGRRFVAVEGRKPILLVQPAPLATGTIDAVSLRESRLTNVNRYAVTRMTYEAGDARLVANRADEASWTMEGGKSVAAETVLALLVKILEAPTKGWSDGGAVGKPTAQLTYAVEGGGEGRVAFYGSRATWDAVPGAVAELVAPPPAVPAPQ